VCLDFVDRDLLTLHETMVRGGASGDEGGRTPRGQGC
jgi:hypothetical protein